MIIDEKEFARYLAGHLKQIAREEEELGRLAEQARKNAGKIAGELVKQYGVNRVYLFGSLVQGDFVWDSDIDLAVEGLPEELFLKAYGLAEELATPVKVDLVLLETASPGLRECILREGKVLYDLQGEKDRPLKKTCSRCKQRP
jgi:predicted nucleotidyltransferase